MIHHANIRNRNTMKSLRLISCLIALTLLAACVTTSSPPPPVRVLLIGDSTMAKRTGYGDALCQRFSAQVTCVNLARGGRSSGSFRAEGLWDQAMQLMRDGKPFSNTYVLIQFGHNDQPGKPGRSTDLVTEFPVNMARYVDEVRATGATPVLVTPLTRRVFRNGVLNNDLEPWSEAVRKIAAEKQVSLLDLNSESSAAVSRMGSLEADTFAMMPRPDPSAPAVPPDQDRFDHTHLGTKGAAYFSAMMARQIGNALPKLGNYFQAATT